jgi:hypothetical protein
MATLAGIFQDWSHKGSRPKRGAAQIKDEFEKKGYIIEELNEKNKK